MGLTTFQTDVGEFGVHQYFNGGRDRDLTGMLAVRKSGATFTEWWAFKIRTGSNGNGFVHPGVEDHSIIADLRFEYLNEEPGTIGEFESRVVSQLGVSYELFVCTSKPIGTKPAKASPSGVQEGHPHYVSNTPGWAEGRFEIFQRHSGVWIHAASLNILEKSPGKSYLQWWAFRLVSGSPQKYERPSKQNRDSTLCYRWVAPPESELTGFTDTLPWPADVYEETLTRSAVRP